MKNKIRSAIVGLIALGANTCPAEGNLDISISDKYLAGKGGFNVHDGSVVQSYLDTSNHLGTLYAWTNSRVNENDVSELDLGFVSPSLKSKDLGASLEFAGYTYPNSEEKFNYWDYEVGANLFTQNLPIDFSLYGGINFAGDKQSEVFRLRAKKSVDLGNKRVSLEGNIVYGNEYYSNKRGFSHFTLKPEISVPVGRNSQIYGTVILQEELENFEKAVNDEACFSGGLRVSF